MNFTIMTLSLMTIAIPATTLAAGLSLHCKGTKFSEYEVSLKQGTMLSKTQFRALSTSMRKNIAGADSVYNYQMTIYRGEAPEQVVAAIGAESDVLLQVYAVKGAESVSTYLDEIGPRDNSSTLSVDRMNIEVSCQVSK